MKKLFLSMSLMLAALTLTNCTKDAAEDKAIVDNGKGFSFTANIDGVGDTKATLEGVKTVWEAGDQVGFGGIKESDTYATARLYGFDYVSGNVFSNAKSTFSTPNQFYAIFPTALDVTKGEYLEVYTANYTDDATKVNTSKHPAYFNVGYNGTDKTAIVQNGASAAHVPAYSPMYWMSNGAISPENLAVQFHHTTSLMKFTVINTEEKAITVKSVRLAVPTSIDICGTYYINFENGELIPSGANFVYSSATVEVEGAAALAKGESFDVYMPVAPFALAAGDAVTIIVSATDGSICTVEKTMKAAIAFEAGKINTATVNFVKDVVENPEITVKELIAEIKAGKTSFVGKELIGVVSAFAADKNQNLSFGSVILTDNTGEEDSAITFFNSAANGLYSYDGLTVGNKLKIDLKNAVPTALDNARYIQINNVVEADVIDSMEAEPIPVVAKEITVAEYLANAKAYNNLYLKFVDVKPAASSVGATATQALTFTQDGNNLTVYNRGTWAEGKNIKIADVQGTLYAFAQYYNAPQVVPTTKADIEAFTSPYEVDKNSVSFAADGGTEPVKVTLKKEGYTLGAVENTAAWLTVTPASDGTILFTAAANTETTPRNVNVTIAVMKDGAAFATITIAVSQKEFGNTTVEETVTFVPGDLTLTNGAIIGEKDGVSVNHVQGASTSKLVQPNNDWRIYKSSDCTITAPGNISKIVFTYAGSDKKYWVVLEVNTGTFTVDGNIGTWTGDASSVNLKASNGQARVAKMEVTYTK